MMDSRRRRAVTNVEQAGRSRADIEGAGPQMKGHNPTVPETVRKEAQSERRR